MDNVTKLPELAKQKFGTLTEAEQKFFRAVAKGEVADYSAEVEENNNPEDAANWGPERMLKADRVAWLCTDKRALELVTHRGIHTKGLNINGKIDLMFAKISFPLYFEKNSVQMGINLQNAEIAALNLRGTHIGQMEADGIKVKGCVLMCDGFKAEDGVVLVDATIGDYLDCSDGQFINRKEYALIGNRLKVGGSVFLSNGFKAKGEVRLIGATIGVDLNCRNAEFINEHEISLSADGLTVEGSVHFDEGFIAKGEVRLNGARIGGLLTCINGKFINPGGKALVADMAEVTGYVMLRDGFKAEGEVNLLNARIGSSLECDGGQFVNVKGRALNADKVKIMGNVFLRDGFKAEGLISLVGSAIDGSLVCVDVAKSGEMKLDLRSAKIGTLWDEKKSWPESGKLSLDGLVYNYIDDEAPKDSKKRIEWLHLQYDELGKARFQPQPYEQIAAALRKSGYDADAKKILIAKNEDKARLTKLTWSEWLWYRIFGRMIGYGYRPWRAAWIGLVIVLLGWFFFWAGSRADVIIPSKEGAYISDDSDKGWRLSEHYPTFFAPVYSLDVFVPLVDLHQASYWLPSDNRYGELHISENRYIPISGQILLYYFWFEIISGWVLTTLLVVGVTGLVRT